MCTTSDDFTVLFSNCSFERNQARFGGASAFQKATIVHITSTSYLENMADESAGAVQVHDTAQVSCQGCMFVSNAAGTNGGALEVAGITFLRTVANFTAIGSIFDGNYAARLGGAIAVASASTTDGSIVSLIQSSLTRNSAEKGGGGIFQTGETAQLVIMGGVVIDNDVRWPHQALQFSFGVAGAGGGVHLENPASAVFGQGVTLGGNAASVGADIFWRYENKTVVDVCVLPMCVVTAATKATQSWGAIVASAPRDTYLFQSGVAVDRFAGDTPLTVEIVDFYGRGRALEDYTSTCTVTTLASAVTVLGASLIVAEAGLVDFSAAQVTGPVNRQFEVEIRCTINDGTVPHRGRITVAVLTWTIGRCHPGWALNSAKTCTVCPAATYSTRGEACVPCPDGAVCMLLPAGVAKDGPGVVKVGAVEPMSLAGFWLAPVSSTLVSDYCETFVAQSGGCPPGEYVQAQGTPTQTCTVDTTKFTSTQVYGCVERFQFYTCVFATSCHNGSTQSNVSRLGPGIACTPGYHGVLCSVCVLGYTKGADGSCAPCRGGSSDDAAALAGHDASASVKAGYVAVAVACALVAILIIGISAFGIDEFASAMRDAFFSCVACCIVRWDTRMKKDGKYTADNTATAKSAKPYRTMRRKVIANRVASSLKQFGAEKTKMLLAFGQIFSGFRTALRVKFPPRAVAMFSVFDFVSFDFMRLTSFDCVVQSGYYTEFGFMFMLPLFIAALMAILYFSVKRKAQKRLPEFTKEYVCPMGFASRKNLGQLSWTDAGTTASVSMRGRLCPCGGSSPVSPVASVAPPELATDNPRIRAISCLVSMGAMKGRMWHALTSLRDGARMLDGSAICECIPRDVDAEKPPSYMLCARGTLHYYLLAFRGRVSRVMFTVMLVAYAPLSSKILNIWNCTEIAGQRYLTDDLFVTCDDETWGWYSLWAGVAVIIYVIGIPVMFWVTVRSARSKSVEEYVRILTPSLATLNFLIRYHKRKERDDKITRVANKLKRKESTAAERVVGIADVADIPWSDEVSCVNDKASKAMVAHANRVMVVATTRMTVEFTARDLYYEARSILSVAANDAVRRLEKGEVVHDILKENSSATEMREVLRSYLHRTNLESSWTKAACGFVYVSYGNLFWWYENVETARKLFLTGLILFFSDAAIQLVVTTVVAFAAVCALAMFKPYKLASDNKAAGSLLIQIFLTAFLGILVHIQNVDTRLTKSSAQTLEVVGYIIVIFCVLVLALIMYVPPGAP